VKDNTEFRLQLMHHFMAQFTSKIACYTNRPFNVKKKTSQKTIKVVKFIP